MGVVKKLHATRLASQLAFMMIEYIRRAGNGHYGITRAEIGWILDDNRADDLDRRRHPGAAQPHLPDLREAIVMKPPGPVPLQDGVLSESSDSAPGGLCSASFEISRRGGLT